MGVEVTPGDQVPLLAGAAITPPSRTVNDLVGVSEPVAGSTARPRVFEGLHPEKWLVAIRDDDRARAA